MNPEQNEKPVVRTTIVGGRPPGSGRGIGTIPRGVEVLLKKAAVDPEFSEKLLEQRAAAGALIGMELDPPEQAILAAVSREQLAQMIAQTVVPMEQRRVFLGQLATAMLAVLGVGVAGCGREPEPVSLGAQPDRPAPSSSRGIQPDRPKPATNPPAPPSTTKGIQPDRPAPSTNAPVADPAPHPVSAGVRPHP